MFLTKRYHSRRCIVFTHTNTTPDSVISGIIQAKTFLKIMKDIDKDKSFSTISAKKIIVTPLKAGE